MNAILPTSSATYMPPATPVKPIAPIQSNEEQPDQDELKTQFQNFVGQTLFGEMLKSMRKTQNETPYFNGGRAEKVFQQQLDQVLVEKMSDASADQLSGPMFDLFMMKRM